MGRSGRVGHMDFREQIRGLKSEQEWKSKWNETRVFRNENGMRGSEDRSSSMVLHRV